MKRTRSTTKLSIPRRRTRPPGVQSISRALYAQVRRAIRQLVQAR